MTSHLRYLETHTGDFVTYFIAGTRDEIHQRIVKIFNEFPSSDYSTDFSPIKPLSTNPSLLFSSGSRKALP